jgi:hypothetical protein
MCMRRRDWLRYHPSYAPDSFGCVCVCVCVCVPPCAQQVLLFKRWQHSDLLRLTYAMSLKTYARGHVIVREGTYIRAFVVYVCLYVRKFVWVYVCVFGVLVFGLRHEPQDLRQGPRHRQRGYVHVCNRSVCVYVCTYVCVCMYVCMYVCMRVRSARLLPTP